ncbi:unnamed protein product [[Actinomadura] parvosata subsp. kistnae]|uniref:Uncharacterized protein n=1 Tax=[Actinomadura] parvosata subsp. kistnae TaxID=1909395 RepID=A0A1V0A6M9_9ACTN|nr:hypothetical protein [Nonomuraea sp. ATCC 55076]AQZ65865.1 hypothetical protein BKM31_34320 [Nonomuraea sp. ATCC 55076]SPL97304.1 unnamed protein product [Actinomadura parvosata subsp. kistnae]
MIRKVCAVSAVLAAVAGGALLAVPAHADDDWAGPLTGDTWSANRSANADSSQSGNTFGDVLATNHGAGHSTNVNNVNGFATTAANGGIAVTYVFD